MFFCEMASCSQYKTQPLYCILCNDDDMQKHDHRARTIANKGDSAKADWQKIRTMITDTLTKSKNWFDLHGVLVQIMSDPRCHGNYQMLND